MRVRNLREAAALFVFVNYVCTAAGGLIRVKSQQVV